MSRWYPCVYCTEDLHCTKYEEPGCESWCVLGPCTEETPSHGDQIRRMIDEELADFMFEHGGSAPNCRENKLHHACKSCNTCWLEWLKKEAKND